MGDAYSLMDDGWSLIDDGLLMMDNRLPRTSYPSLIAFLAFVFQENTPRKNSYASLMKFLAGGFRFPGKQTPKLSYASLITFLAGAFVFQGNTPRKKLCVSDHVPSRGFCFPRSSETQVNFLLEILTWREEVRSGSDFQVTLSILANKCKSVSAAAA